MKADAHIAVDEGFDVKLIAAAEELGPDVTQIPVQFNLHIFNRQCRACGVALYQGPTNVPCDQCKASAGFDRVMVWNPKRRKTQAWRFDSDLKFQYFGEYQARQTGDYPDTMSCLGACWFLSRERYWQLGGLDEGHGSWGQMGTELACKSWLSGGRMLVNTKTWFSHAFRTQGGDWGFPYPLSGSDVDHARTYSQNLWRTNSWPGQVKPLRWLVEKFSPVPEWTQEQIDALPRELPHRGATGHAAQRLDHTGISASAGAMRAGTAETGCAHGSSERVAGVAAVQSVQPLIGQVDELQHGHAGLRASDDRVRGVGQSHRSRDCESNGQEDGRAVRVGIVYYSDSHGDESILEACRTQLQEAARGLPIVSVTLKPLAFGKNIVLDAERGVLTMFRQILAGLEALDTDVAFLAEHDVLYSAEHFQFTPPRHDAYFYDLATWKVNADDGRAVHYRTKQTSGLCANRDLLIQHYRKRVAKVEQDGFSRAIGFEPGSHKRKARIDDYPSGIWWSKVPNIDIRHGHNLTQSRWSPEQFRDQRNCEGWTESDSVPGWGQTKGRFREFLADVSGALVTR